jgi:tetratricopeptide (TPR) repeat protein
VPGLVSTSHGRFSRAGLQEAEHYYRRALAADGSLAVVRVRLGRLLYLSDRTAEAMTELEQALREASAADSAVPAYWAALQLGLAREQAKRADARDAYTVAVRIHPGGRSAHLALGALAAGDRVADAWAYADTSLGVVGADGRGDLDPWVLYPFLDLWRLPRALATMRDLVPR